MDWLNFLAQRNDLALKKRFSRKEIVENRNNSGRKMIGGRYDKLIG